MRLDILFIKTYYTFTTCPSQILSRFLLFTVYFHSIASNLLKRIILCFDAGGGHPGGGQHHRAGDISAPPAGLALHPVLHVQALLQQEEEEEAAKEEGLQSARPLHILAAATRSHLPDHNYSICQVEAKESKSAERTYEKKKCFLFVLRLKPLKWAA